MQDTPEEYQGQDLTTEIQKCRKQVEFWTKRQEKLEAKQRHEFLMQRIAEDPRSTWNALTETERTKEVVLAILACDPHFFGECPWEQDRFNPFMLFIPRKCSKTRILYLRQWRMGYRIVMSRALSDPIQRLRRKHS